jgi:general secretion pathway protein D
MIFLRPVILKDERSAAALTVDRYDYIRNLQNEMKLPPSLVLPGEGAKVLPSIDESRNQPLGK